MIKVLLISIILLGIGMLGMGIRVLLVKNAEFRGGSCQSGNENQGDTGISCGCGGQCAGGVQDGK